ncbi:hypothetical protein HW423_02015 [Aerococcaceae bacterium INB8]|uniref:Uncharacterized protein n=1 Tax=Ruoffia halotolerans TaxID=2748684 RepID=A0A839A3M4_9LACT|nr:hypothetical protein [Ruoffia halotolerans]MBA5728562.1 hypothetical protein [Ruoffia halotolerans]
MVRKIIEEQNEKAIETLARIAVKDDLAEFKSAFKEKYQSDWDTIVETLRDEDHVDGLSAPEHFLEELFKENRQQINE